MVEQTPERVERDLVRGRLDPSTLPDVVAVWLAESALDTPALRELAGHPRSDVDGIRRLWAEARDQLGVRTASSPETDRLTRSQFVDTVELLADALDAHPHDLSADATDLLLELWFALNGPVGPQIEALSPDETSLIVRACALYCDATDPQLRQGPRRGASAEAADHLRTLTRMVLLADRHSK